MSDEIPPTPPAVPPEPPEEQLPKVGGWKEFFKSPLMAYPTASPAEKSWATGLHASGFAGFIFVIPFANIIVPLVIWLIKRPESAYLDAVGKEVVNFQISAAIFGVGTAIIAGLIGCLIIPIALPFIVLIAWVVYMIKAIMATSDGGDFRYPATIRFIK